MSRKYIYLLLVVFVLSNAGASIAIAQQKPSKTVVAKKKNTISKGVLKKTSKKTSLKTKSTANLKKYYKKSKAIISARNRKSKSHYKVVTDTAHLQLASENKKASLQMIEGNKEKTRVSDSLHKTTLLNVNDESREGYFATGFSVKSNTANFQTMEGTASTFKSLSGWDDKKFYILTNQMPIGTIVRVTTPDAKSICAKVINILPDEGTEIQYRISDSAAANLGISNKTFKVSVTY
jgi:hypothetical protein